MAFENSSRAHAAATVFHNLSTKYLSQKDIWPWRIGLFGVGGACVASVGLVCNCIAIVVLVHYKRANTRSSAPILLIALEVFNTIYLLFQLFLENMAYIASGGIIPKSYVIFMAPVYCVAYPVPPIAWTCSTFLVVVITLERYIVVARPLSAHSICRPQNAKLAVLIVAIAAMLYHIPSYMAYTCTKAWDNSTQTERTRFQRSVFGSSFYYVRVHVTWVKLCVHFIIPFVLLLTLNGLLLTVLWRSKRSVALANIHTHARKEKKLTVMVVCMTCVFLLCELMAAVSFILTSGLNRHVECSYNCNRFTAVADTLVIVNAAANFAIYCASGKKFRDIFSQIFLKRLRSRSRGSSGSTGSSSRLKTSLSSLLMRPFRTDRSIESNVGSSKASRVLYSSNDSPHR